MDAPNRPSDDASSILSDGLLGHWLGEEALVILGVLEKLALLPSGLTIHACGVGCASGADADAAVGVAI